MTDAMQFAVETWAPDYGSSIEADLDLSTQLVDAGVEVADSDWSPIDPRPELPRPGRMLFVDGVRRVDARIWIARGASSTAALCATIAAGVVCVEADRAQLVDARVMRGVFAHGVDLQAIATSCGIYEPHEVAGATPEALVIAVQERMASLESEATLAMGAADIVLVDGPLRGRGQVRGAVGYVKTQHTQYLPPPLDGVVGRLGVGQRTPLFAIEGHWSRFSWYVRLPGVVTHALAGIVRCEIGGEMVIDQACSIADAVTAVLPRFASQPHKDARAPQNLYPIAGLERELRRRLGDPALLERALRVAAHR